MDVRVYVIFVWNTYSAKIRMKKLFVFFFSCSFFFFFISIFFSSRFVYSVLCKLRRGYNVRYVGSRSMKKWYKKATFVALQSRNTRLFWNYSDVTEKVNKVCHVEIIRIENNWLKKSCSFFLVFSFFSHINRNKILILDNGKIRLKIRPRPDEMIPIETISFFSSFLFFFFSCPLSRLGKTMRKLRGFSSIELCSNWIYVGTLPAELWNYVGIYENDTANERI